MRVNLSLAGRGAEVDSWAIGKRLQKRFADPDTQVGVWHINSAGQFRLRHYANRQTRAVRLAFINAILSGGQERYATAAGELSGALWAQHMYLTSVRWREDGTALVPTWRDGFQKGDDAWAAWKRRRLNPSAHLAAAARWRDANREFKRASDRLRKRLLRERKAKACFFTEVG